MLNVWLLELKFTGTNENIGMKKISIQFFLLLLIFVYLGFAQTNPVLDIFPESTVLHGNMPYNNDTLGKHLLDIYLPADAKGKLPLVIFIHGDG
jgi:hypothetical protein